MYERLRAIARIAKTHGKRGEVVTVPVGGLPLLVREGLRVCAVPPELAGERWHVAHDVRDGGRGQLVRLSGVGDISAAEALVGKTLLAPVDELPDDLDLHDPAFLLGTPVTDERAGAIGEVSEVMAGPANDVWAVEGPFGEVLLPVVDEVVLGVGEDGSILVRLPEGTLPPDGGEA